MVTDAVRRYLDPPGQLKVVTGGQRGVDLWAAGAAQDLGVPFEVILPVPETTFPAAWPDQDRAVLRGALTAARRVDIVDPRLVLGALAYDLRNERMVRRADRLIAVWTGIRRGGTFQTLCAARARGIAIEEILLDVVNDAPPMGRGV